MSCTLKLGDFEIWTHILMNIQYGSSRMTSFDSITTTSTTTINMIQYYSL